MTHRSPISVNKLLEVLREPQSVRDLVEYFTTYTGRNFDTLDGGGDREDIKDRFTCCDIVAVECLSVDVPKAAACKLISDDEGSLGEQASELLRQIPVGVDLGSPGAGSHLQDGQHADRLWKLLDNEAGIGWVIAGKLVARKRPTLVPVYDEIVRCAYGRPEQFWTWLGELVEQHRDIGTQLTELHSQANLSPLVSPLRVLDVVLWMRHRRTHCRGGCLGL
ncbi:MAG: DUF6308 family protein [Acidimicrobiales bacterium]